MSLKEFSVARKLRKTAFRIGFVGIAGAVASACSSDQKASAPILTVDTPTPITRLEPTLIPTPTKVPTLQPTRIPPTSEVIHTSTPRPIPTLEPNPTPTQARTSPTAAPTTRPATPTSEATSTPEAKDKGINFVFGEGVTVEQQKEIKDGIIMARESFAEKAGIRINDVSIFASANFDQIVDQYLQRTIYPRTREQFKSQFSSIPTAFTGEKKDMFIITSSRGWTDSPPIIGGPIAEGRLHTLIHEWLHIFQREVGGYNQRPIPWLNEGGAHYFAGRVLSYYNRYPYSLIRAGHVGEAKGVRENLSFLESDYFYNEGKKYSLAFLAMEYLTKDLPNDGIPAIVRFWQELGKGGLTWQNAFLLSFGQTPDEFYPKFEQLRQNGFR